MDVDGVVTPAGCDVGTVASDGAWMGALCGIWPRTLMMYHDGCLFGFVFFFPLSEPNGRLGDIATIKLYKTTKLNIKYEQDSYFTV